MSRVLFVVFLGLLSISSAASATQISHGTECVPWYHEPGVVHYGENGRVANQSLTDFMTLTCPVSMTTVNRDRSPTYEDVKIWVRDDNPYSPVSCAIYRQQVNLNSRTWYDLGTTSVDDSIFRPLARNNVPIGGLVSVPDPVFGGYSAFANYIVCRLPPGGWGTSAISVYQVR